MTRETKIGLLVGLAFIIMIGILLSDHFRSTMEPMPAALGNAASSVREAINSPGAVNPPISIVAPTDVAPRQQVPTHEELNLPVIVSPVKSDSTAGNINTQYSNVPRNNGNMPTAVIPPGGMEADGPGVGTKELANIAHLHGEQIVQLNTLPTPVSNQPTGPVIPAPPAALKSYTAQSGDSVSRMAARLMGADNRPNRQAIINANPSLQDDPDYVVVGQIYVIPTAASANAPAPANAPAVAQAPAQVSAQYVYTVQSGDSLWRIANDQLGDPSQVDAIKELNTAVLKGPDHDILIVGIKLKLPAKPVASAN